MKKISFFFSIAAVCALLASCDHFLRDQPGDLLVPHSVNEFQQVLYGEGYPRSFDKDADWIKLCTDDVEMGELECDALFQPAEKASDLTNGEGKLAYTWLQNYNSQLYDNNWSARYSNILGCNTVIQALPDITYAPVEVNKYNLLAAQAYALRAYHYFCLVNLYALPWSEANLDKPGVILRTSPNVDVEPKSRASIGDIYALINSDLELAMEYMAKTFPSANKNLISGAAIQLLRNRVDLFQERWDKVIEEGEYFLSLNPSIKNLSTVAESKMGIEETGNFFIMDMAQNPEIIFTFGTSSSDYYYISGTLPSVKLGFRVSAGSPGALWDKYETNDLRSLAWFEQDLYSEGNPYWGLPSYWDYFNHYPLKYSSVVTGNYRENWRTVEVLLNVAEAYARKASGVSTEAIDLLNKLRQNRFRTAGYVAKKASDFADKQALVNFVWDERRRELCFEEAMRFWDMRRQGMPAQSHKFYSTLTNYETYNLPQGSGNYVLAIPTSETKYNSDLAQNARDIITPQ